MAKHVNKPRLIVLANTAKPEVVEALNGTRPWLAGRADIVAEPDVRKLDRESAQELPAADFAVVFGGDGTMMAQARNVIDLQIPVVGVNLGSVGFLTEFSIDDLKKYWDIIAAGKCAVSERVMIDLMVFTEDASDCRIDRLDMDRCKYQSVAFNDAVITAGPPFHMIELELCIDPGKAQSTCTVFKGDGVIVSTPSGSTAYNLSANGPIVSPDVNALCITPICPQSISFRPVVVSGDSGIALRVTRANEGTTLFIDGQEHVKLLAGEQVYIRKDDQTSRIVLNPDMSYWKKLTKKMHWAVRPRNSR